MAHPTTTRRTLTVQETGSVMGLSRSATYRAIREGEIPSIRIGFRLLVPIEQLEDKFGITIDLGEAEAS